MAVNKFMSTNNPPAMAKPPSGAQPPKPKMSHPRGKPPKPKMGHTTTVKD